MKRLTKKYNDAANVRGRLTSWLQSQQKSRVQNVVYRARARGEAGEYVLWNITALLTMLTAFVFLRSPHIGLHDHWPPVCRYLLLSVVVMGIIGGMFSWIRGKATRIIRSQLRATLEPEFDHDPLVQRARLIVEASNAYAAHCTLYRRWCAEVEKDLTPPHDATATEYREFLASARGVICSAAENFWDVVERLKRARALERMYPHAANDADERGLTLLLEELRSSTPTPPVLERANPILALESEERLQRTAQELKRLEAQHT